MQQFNANKCMQWNTRRVLACHEQISQCKLTSCRMNTKHNQSNITIQIESSNSKQIYVCNGIWWLLEHRHRNERKCKLTPCKINRKHSQSNITLHIECRISEQINVCNGIHAGFWLATDTSGNANLPAAEWIESTFNQTSQSRLNAATQRK